MIQLTECQQDILEKVKQFADSSNEIFILKGYAGTGKTTLVKYIVNMLARQQKPFKLMAPTGRAAKVLGEKTGYKTTTIHKGIYAFDHLEIQKVQTSENEYEFKYIFPLASTKSSTINIIDEASMVSSMKSSMELFQFGTDIMMDDLLTYGLQQRSKLIFVGDPAQLPPVGDNKSNALDAEYFRAKGLKAQEEELTEVLRQGEGSLILENAMQVRDLLSCSKRNTLNFKTDLRECIELHEQHVVDKFMELFPNPKIGESVIIAFSNQQCRDFNLEVREKLYPGRPDVCSNDILMVVHNNYRYGLMNGDFITVASSGPTEIQSAPVFVRIAGEKKKIVVSLTFRDVIIEVNGEPIGCKIIDSMLKTKEPGLTIEEMKALYINFCMRHSNLKPGSEEFMDVLKEDPYYNALWVKYGYAVTGHKCQGGEWDTVLVDYTGRTGLNNDHLRWTYTATTRAQHVLYGVNMPHVSPFCTLKFDAVIKIKKAEKNARAFQKNLTTPFHNAQSPDGVKAKYHAVADALEGSPYTITNVDSKSWLEIYTIEGPLGKQRFDGYYNVSYVFQSFKPFSQNAETEDILRLIDNEEFLPIQVDYEPDSKALKDLYFIVMCVCSELGIKIMNIEENQNNYFVNYHLKTSGCFSFLKFYWDINLRITHVTPFSDLGTDDELLKELIQKLELLTRI